MKIKIASDGGYVRLGNIIGLEVEAEKIAVEHRDLFSYGYKVSINQFKKHDVETRYYDWLGHLVFSDSEVEEL